MTALFAPDKAAIAGVTKPKVETETPPRAPVVWEELGNNPRDGFASCVTITSRRCSLADKLDPGVGELRALRGCVEGAVDSLTCLVIWDRASVIGLRMNRRRLLLNRS